MDTNRFIINKVLNKDNTYYITILLFIFIFYLIIEHVIDLTKMVFSYRTSYDYGDFLQKICVKEYFEYETGRYHVINNSNNIILNNDINKGHYMTFILVITILIAIFISFLFSYIIYNTFFNRSFIYKLINKGDNSDKCKNNNIEGDENIISSLITYLLCATYQLTIEPFDIIIKVIKKLFISSESSGYRLKNLIFFLFLILMYIIVISVFVLMPIYIGLKLSDKADISPFNTNLQVYIPYIVLFIVIIFMRFSYNIFYKDYKEQESSYKLTNYLSENIDNIFTTNNVTGYIGFFVCMAMYILIFYILGNIIHVYNKYSLGINVEPEVKDNINVNIRNDILNVFMNNVLGFNEYGNYEVPNIFVKNISGITFTIIIVICVMIVILYVCNYIENNENVSNLIKYGAIVPLLILIIILYSIKNKTEYNTFFNKYIITEPSTLYKGYISNIHEMFNKALQKDYMESSDTTSYICKNAGNAILLTLYCDLFNNIDKVNRTGITNDKKYIDITPEFQYDIMCDDTRPFDFKSKEEYDIKYYLNSKTLKKDIFYKFNNCSSINNITLATIGKNLTKIFSNEELENILIKINSKFYSLDGGDLLSEEPMKYIKEEILMKSESIKDNIYNFTEKLKKQMHESIYNIVVNKNVYTDTDKYIYYDESSIKFYKNNKVSTLNKYEIDYYNNKLQSQLKTAIPEHIIKANNIIVDKIVDIYMNIVYAHLYIFTPIYAHVRMTSTAEDYPKYQEEYVRSLKKHIEKVFNDINDTLSSSVSDLKNDKLTRYIITNYNNVYTDKMYTQNKLQYIIPNTKEATINKNIENDVKIYYKYLNSLLNVYKDIQELLKAFQTNSYTNLEFVSLLYDNKYIVNNYINDFNKYIKKREIDDIETNKDLFKNNINMIFRYDDNQYDFAYETYTLTEKKTIMIDMNIYSMTIDMMNVGKKIVYDIENKYNILIQKNLTEDDYKKIEKYDEFIDKYINILNKNIISLKNDYKNYTENKKYVNKIIGYNSADNLTKNISENISKDAKLTDKLIYMVVINYVIVLILPNLIIM